MSKQQRYFSETDPAGVTRGQLKRVGRKRQREYMRHWFQRQFEDPRLRSPHTGSGVFLFPIGGPYDARAVLQGEFEGFVSDAQIEAVAQEIERLGIEEWAPGLEHPDQEKVFTEISQEQQWFEDNIVSAIRRLEEGQPPKFGSRHELVLRDKLLHLVAELKRTLARETDRPAGIGHNHPPEDDDDQSQSELFDDLYPASGRGSLKKPPAEALQPPPSQVLIEEAEFIANELRQAAPDALGIMKATTRLERSLSWVGEKSDAAAQSFAKSFGSLLGKLTAGSIVAIVGQTFFPSAAKIVYEIVRTVAKWITYIAPPI